jgi:hypothetical protein
MRQHVRRIAVSWTNTGPPPVTYNRLMHSDDLVRLLAGVPGTEVSAGAGMVSAYVPAIGDAVQVAADDVLHAEPATVPTGASAIRLGIRRGHEELPVIITVGDVVFMPAYAADLVEPDPAIPIPAAPHLVAYSEMHRDVRALGRAVDTDGVKLDPDMLAATLLVHRCFLAGAVRVGLWPVRAAAWWEYTWSRVGAGLTLAPFRADPVWDRLMSDVAQARQYATGDG